VARSILVTGGNRGIGLAIAHAFAKQGDRVAVTHRGSGVPEDVLGVRCDVTDSAAVEAAFAVAEQAHGPIEVLVSNAGITDDTLLLRMTEDQFSRVLDTNLTGAYRVAKRAAKSMLRARWGRMVFISSVVALSGAPGQVNYAASKAGLIGLVEALAPRAAEELGGTVNAVAPGFIDTQMTAAVPLVIREVGRRLNTLRQAGLPIDVAETIAYLAAPGSGHVNGQTLRVCGQSLLGA
jgi:beta-ketoacyl ACP reductase